MTARSKPVIKSYFERGLKPSESQYIDLIDSYQDYSDVINNINLVVSAGTDGVLNFIGSAASILPAGAVGKQLLATVTTAAAQAALSLNTASTPQFARLGLGQAADSSAVMAATGQYFSTLATTTVALNWNIGNVQTITLANGAQVFTFSNPKSGGRYLLELKQPAAGAAGTITWPASVLWPSGVAPTLTATNGKIDVIALYYNGTNYLAASNLNY